MSHQWAEKRDLCEWFKLWRPCTEQECPEWGVSMGPGGPQAVAPFRGGTSGGADVCRERETRNLVESAPGWVSGLFADVGEPLESPLPHMWHHIIRMQWVQCSPVCPRLPALDLPYGYLGTCPGAPHLCRAPSGATPCSPPVPFTNIF